MANWSNPTLTSTYTNFVAEVKDRDMEAAVWFEGMSPTNLPTNAKRLNTSTGRFEKWNGSAWVDAVATFTFPALTVAGAAAFNGNTTIGDAGTDTLTVNAAATFAAGVTFSGASVFNAAATFNGNVTFGDSSADTATVNATLSFATAPVLTPGSANGVLFLNGSKFLSAGTGLVFNGTSLGLGTGSPGADIHILRSSANASFRMSSSGGSGRDWDIKSQTDGYLTIGSDLLAGQLSLFAGRLGVSVSPSGSWQADTRSIEISLFTSIFNDNGLGSAEFAYNTISNGSGSYIYARSGVAASRLQQRDGAFHFFTAGSSGGTAGSAISFTAALSIDASANLISGGTGHWRLPRGTTAQRPTGASGMIRFNSDLNKYEGHNGSSWSSIGGGATGGGSDDIFYENGQTVSSNYTITSGKNAMSAGPVTIASGITVTVPSGSNWVVV